MSARVATRRAARHALLLDLKLGFSASARWYPLTALFALCSIELAVAGSDFFGIERASLTWADHLALFVGGCEPYVFRQGLIFIPPAGWLLGLLLLAYMTLGHPYRDLMGFGQHALMRTSRASWWLSKCAWIVLTVLAYWAVVVAAATVITVLDGAAFSLRLTQGAFTTVTGLANVPPGGIGGLPFFAGVLGMSVALCLAQMTLAFIVRPSVAFGCMAALLVVSAHTMHPALLGNYLMLARLGGAVPGGVSPFVGLGIAAVLASGSVMGGLLFFRRTDLVAKELFA